MNHRIAVVVALALSIGVTARAQPVSSFEELHGLIERGADVVVTHDGRHSEGRVLELSPTSLALVSGEGRLLELDAAGVTRIRQRWHDPTRDGALKGLAWVAVPLGAWYLKHMEFEMEFTGPGLLVAVAASSFAGYVIGGAVDARKTEMRDVYRAPPRRPRTSVAPLLSRDGLGGALSISW